MSVNLFEQMDQLRRLQGGMIEAAGLGPAETPSRVVLSEPAFTLRAYADPHGPGPALLIVPAPIKRAYIWDLAPAVSAVREFLSRAIRVYLLHWERPGPEDEDHGLDFYAHRHIISCLDAIESETREGRIFLAGHSLGGTFSVICASLAGERVRGLVLLGAPVSFGPRKGALDDLVASAPRIEAPGRPEGNIPGSFLSAISLLASPRSFQYERLEDWLSSFMDWEAMQTHLGVERWTLDEMPIPRKLFDEVVEDLYRCDSFVQGDLAISGRRALPSAIDSPILAVADEHSDVVTPRSSLTFLEKVSSADRQVLWYRHDVGVALQHVGVLVGREAHRVLWPQILDWVQSHG